jgi:hypothetical protein
MKAQLAESRDKFALPPVAIARAIAFAIEQPADVDVKPGVAPSHVCGCLWDFAALIRDAGSQSLKAIQSARPK